MLKAYNLEMICNAGHSFDLSRAVMQRAMTHCDNVYRFPYIRVQGKLAKTNLASNTAYVFAFIFNIMIY
jgi:xanthine dehydrogenase/oxidase